MRNNYNRLAEDKYSALVRDHDKLPVEKATAVQELGANKTKIAKLTQMLETLRSKQHDNTNEASVKKTKKLKKGA